MEGALVYIPVVFAPVLVVPLIVVLYLTIGGIHASVKGAKEKRLAREKNIAVPLTVNK